eukprot:CAMPEP_0204149450 /NCGR_PEP_ID=MMETSP0361-20130328/24409_1 /ASSEMBLY_ACC=CAM_ASM_000343 /TAXON_ID=268821 /ORGANISM="Scrippsiella Hangoei, Strain SHTV-5" /LENGTH=94 /DNA_ID=CAMNT_0051103957 /DNA_START=805 /DNA_END=1089 /DNA_ORIENTATION=+
MRDAELSHQWAGWWRIAIPTAIQAPQKHLGPMASVVGAATVGSLPMVLCLRHTTCAMTKHLLPQKHRVLEQFREGCCELISPCTSNMVLHAPIS